MILANLLLLIALPVALAQGPIADGQPCTADTECQSRNCNVPPVGPGNKQCLPRPGVVNSPCLKDLEATDCTTGYCNDQGRCARVAPGQTCKEDNDCDGSNVICRVTPFKTQVCLETNLPDARACALNEQCQSNNCPAPFYQCRPAGETISVERQVGDACDSDTQCITGICDDEIKNDGFKKVCLQNNVNAGDSCSTDRQCSTGYCFPSNTDPSVGKSLTCGTKPTDPPPSTPSTPSTNPDTQPSNPDTQSKDTSPSQAPQPSTGSSGGDQPSQPDQQSQAASAEVVVETATTVENGQTRTVIGTRTVFVSRSTTRAASAAASATSRSAGTAGSGAPHGAGWATSLLGCLFTAIFL